MMKIKKDVAQASHLSKPLAYHIMQPLSVFVEFRMNKLMSACVNGKTTVAGAGGVLPISCKY